MLAAATSAAGQNFVFFTIAHFSSLTLATITTTRKFFTILLSVLYFRHELSARQCAGVGLVFVGLGMELWNKYTAGHASSTIGAPSVSSNQKTTKVE